MAEILFRSDEHRFSVYRASAVPDGVRRSLWSTAENPGDYWTPRVEEIRGRIMLVSKWSRVKPPPNDAHCAVADEHAGPLLVSRFAVGMRVRMAKDKKVYGTVVGVGANGNLVVDSDDDGDRMVCSAGEMEPVPVAIPDEDFHREQTRRRGAQRGERAGTFAPGERGEGPSWSAHLRFLVDRSAEQDRAREAALVGWDPYGDDSP